MKMDSDKHSPVALSQSYEEFYSTVEFVIAYYPTDIIAFWELREKWQNGRISHSAYKDFLNLQFPPYIHLRALGYSGLDLNAEDTNKQAYPEIL